MKHIQLMHRLEMIQVTRREVFSGLQVTQRLQKLIQTGLLQQKAMVMQLFQHRLKRAARRQALLFLLIQVPQAMN